MKRIFVLPRNIAAILSLVSFSNQGVDSFSIIRRKDLRRMGRSALNAVSFFEQQQQQQHSPRLQKSSSSSRWLFMRDRSASYWFDVGDTVKVVADVWTGSKANNNQQNLKGRIGSVVQTWEKCDVDPTCCCAEQVDTNMAVRVAFDKDSDNEEKFVYYFAEDELKKV